MFDMHNLVLTGMISLGAIVALLVCLWFGVKLAVSHLEDLKARIPAKDSFSGNLIAEANEYRKKVRELTEENNRLKTQNILLQSFKDNMMSFENLIEKDERGLYERVKPVSFRYSGIVDADKLKRETPRERKAARKLKKMSKIVDEQRQIIENMTKDNANVMESLNAVIEQRDINNTARINWEARFTDIVETIKSRGGVYQSIENVATLEKEIAELNDALEKAVLQRTTDFRRIEELEVHNRAGNEQLDALSARLNESNEKRDNLAATLIEVQKELNDAGEQIKNLQVRVKTVIGERDKNAESLMEYQRLYYALKEVHAVLKKDHEEQDELIKTLESELINNYEVPSPAEGAPIKTTPPSDLPEGKEVKQKPIDMHPEKDHDQKYVDYLNNKSYVRSEGRPIHVDVSRVVIDEMERKWRLVKVYYQTEINSTPASHTFSKKFLINGGKLSAIALHRAFNDKIKTF